MSVIAVVLGILLLWILYKYPWLCISLLFWTPVIKYGAYSKIPFFRVVDLTMFVCVMAGIFGLRLHFRNKKHGLVSEFPTAMIVCILIITFILGFSLMWTTAPDFGQMKFMRVLLIGIPFLILPSLYITTEDDAKYILLSFVILAIITAFVMVFFPSHEIANDHYGGGGNYGRRTFMGSDPNSAALTVTCGVLILLASFMSSYAKTIHKITGLILFPLGILAVLLSGSRGTMLGLVLAIFTIPLQSKSKIKTFLLLSLVGTISITILVFVIMPLFMGEIPIDRWLNFADQVKGGDTSSNRLPAWVFCWENAWDGMVVFGHGSGSYAMDYLKKDIPYWPHSIFFECLYETGIIGATAISFFFFYVIKTILQGMKFSQDTLDRYILMATTMCTIPMCLFSLIQWSLDGSRFLFLFSGILFSNTALIKRKHRKRLIALDSSSQSKHINLNSP